MKVENNLGTDSITSLVFRMAIPSMLAQFVSVLYSIVDRMYIGNIPKIGAAALAGVGVCGPVITMIGSIAFWVGIGATPLISIRMGEENLPAAKKIVANAFLLMGVLSLLAGTAAFLFREPMLLLFGASPSTYLYAEEYFSAYLAGTLFAVLATGMNQIIICQGFAKVGMASVMIGAVSNIVLDPVFIFLFDMGVRGAAVATVLSQLFSCIFVLRFLFHKSLPAPITFGSYCLQTMGKILWMGLTPFLIIAIDNVMIIAMNAVLQHYGGPQRGDALVTCATIVQSFMLVITMPLGGISGGTQTILGYNYGSGDTGRVKQAQKRIILMCAGYTALLLLFAQTASPLFIRMFTQDPALVYQAEWAIRVYTLGVIPLGVQYAIVDGFTGIGKVNLSLPLSFFRKLVYFVSLFLLPFLLEAEYTFFAETISDFLGPAASITVFLLLNRRILTRREKELGLYS